MQGESKLKNKTIGEIIKSKRLQYDLSLKEIENELKIKTKYLELIENNDFEKFDSQTQAKGFIKNYAKLLGIKYENLLAIFRRDFENKDMVRKIQIVEDEIQVIKKETFFKRVKNNFEFTRRQAIYLSAFVFIIFAGLLTYFIVKRTFESPVLILNAPIEVTADYTGQLEYDKNEIILRGKTEQGVAIFVNEQPISLSPDYTFETSSIPTTEDETLVVIKAENTLGSKSTIELNLTKPVEIIEEIKMEILIRNVQTGVTVKADGIQVYDGVPGAGELITATGKNTIEISTPVPENLIVRINDQDYELSSVNTVFENVGTKIIQSE